MNPREKFALQKEIRKGLENLKEASMSVREKFAVQKQIRENLIKLGQGVKDENPAAETPMFDKLVDGTIELNESNVAEVLQQIYDELIAAGNDEPKAIAMIKEPVKAYMVKHSVIQEGVDVDPIIDGFLNLFKGKPAQKSHTDVIEENISSLGRKLDLDPAIVQQECFHSDNQAGEIVEGVYRSKFNEDDRFVFKGVVKTRYGDGLAREGSDSNIEFAVEVRYYIDGKERQQHVELTFPDEDQYKDKYEMGQEVELYFVTKAVRFKDGEVFYDLDLDEENIDGFKPREERYKSSSDEDRIDLRSIPEKSLVLKEKTIQEDVGDMPRANILLPIRPPIIPRPNPSLAEKGIYFLNQDISDESVFPIIQEIMKQNTLKPEDRLKEIKIIVASNGGSVEAAFAFIDVANTSAIPIHTTAMGKVKSAGLLIAMSGTKGHRTIFPNTSVLSHQFSWGMRGNEASMNATAVEVQNLGRRLMDHYKLCTGLTEAKVKKELMPSTDRWLTAQQAIEFNLFDRIETGEIYQSAEPDEIKEDVSIEFHEDEQAPVKEDKINILEDMVEVDQVSA
ncbi:ATP-dependent Clp protease proteolytic subunit [bacterium]|nr:ATP-dependent Clp protease proteolytic subunit [bacterium]